MIEGQQIAGGVYFDKNINTSLNCFNSYNNNMENNFKNKNAIFENCLKFAVELKYNKEKNKWEKKNFPKNWSKLTESNYNGEPNYALFTGEKNNITVIDIDDKELFFNLLEKHNISINTYTTTTPNGGLHLFYQYEPRLKSQINVAETKIDILNDNKTVINGYKYEKFNNIETIERIPENFLNVLLEYQYYGKMDNVKDDMTEFLNTHLKCDYIWNKGTYNSYVPNSSICLVSGKQHTHIQSYVASINTKSKKIKLKCHGNCGEKVITYQDKNDVIFSHTFVANVFIEYCESINIKLINYNGILMYWNEKSIVWKEMINFFDIFTSKEFSTFIQKYDFDLKNLAKLGDYNFIEKTRKTLEKSNIRCDIEFDKNPYLIAFNNCILDLKNDVIRDITFDDYITVKIDYDFDETIDETIGYEYINNLFQTKELTDYVLTVLSTCLIGKTHNSFYIFNGIGCNGKSKLIELMDKCLGNYVGTMNATVLMEKSVDSNKPSTDLHTCREKRGVFIQEPEDDCKFNSGMMKKITGDKLKTRTLNEKPVEWIPKMTLILCCNNMPAFTDNSEGFKRRLKIIPFDIKFVDKPTLQHHRLKIDDYKPDEDENLIKSFMKLLVKYAINYIKDGCGVIKNPPEEVVLKIEEYLEDDDTFKEDFLECFEITNDENDILRSKEIKDVMCNRDFKYRNKHISFFTTNMKNLNLAPYKRINNIRVFTGLKIKEKYFD